MNDFKYKRICPFKWYVLQNFPFIEADFDAITNYQLYCKVVEYLNKVIDDMNTLGQQTENITNAMTELQDYVNNYFDNLDVQDEINNKLDEMVEQGTLQEIIADYLNSKAIFGFDTVNDMKQATNLIDGSYARTLGFYNKNDGGGAIYKIRNITNDDTINNMDIISLNDEENLLIAELINDKNNILCYGVSLTDTNNDNHTIINYVLNKYNYGYCKKDIILNNTLEIIKENSFFEFKNIQYNGNDSAIIVNNIYIKIKGEILTSNYNGLRIGKSNVTQWNDIKIEKIIAENVGIVVGGSKGTYYNTIDVKNVVYKTRGILFDNSQYYTGENIFKNMSFDDLSQETIVNQFAVYGDFSSYRSTGMSFENIGFEGAKGGFCFESTENGRPIEHLYIKNCRTSELSLQNNKKVLKLKAPSGGYVYGEMQFDFAKPSDFDFSEYLTNYCIKTFKLKGNFREIFNIPQDVIGTEGYACYGMLIITKLLLPLFAINNTNLQIPKSFVTPLTGNETTAKIKIGTEFYRINGTFKIINASGVTKTVEIYGIDESTPIRSFTIDSFNATNVTIENNFYGKSAQIIKEANQVCNYWDISATN